jgi:hypothetical protein
MYQTGTPSPGSLARKQQSSARCKPQQLLLLATVLALHLATGHVVASHPHTHICADSQTLAHALLTEDVQDVRIAGETLSTMASLRVWGAIGT